MVAFITALLGECGGDQVFFAFDSAVKAAGVSKEQAKQYLNELRKVHRSVSIYPPGFMPDL